MHSPAGHQLSAGLTGSAVIVEAFCELCEAVFASGKTVVRAMLICDVK